jgi:hypothetical protein
MKPEKHIPTIFGVLLLIAAVFGGVILTGKNFSFTSKAGGSCEPINPQITNITHNSAVISFTTSADCLANININNQIIKNDKSSKVHYFEINSLKENSDYTFFIISGGDNFNSSSFQISTAQKLSNQPVSSDLAWGKVFNSDNSPANEVIVYLNIPGAFPLSAITTSSGNWNIPLSTSFNESKTNWFTPPKNLEEEIFVVTPGKNTTQIINNTSINNPVPDIIIGQNSLTSPEVKTEANVGVLPSIDVDLDNSVDKKLDISNPSDNETISTKKPEFFGTAPINSKVTIEVHSSEVFKGEVATSGDGTWNWSVPENLTPGEHTITVTAKNDQGIIETITRKFIVLAAESDTSFTASSSSTKTTPTPTPTTVITITSTPTKTITPTIAITKVENPSTSSGVPKTGAVFPTFTIFLLSIVLLTISLVFYRKN